MSTRWRCAVCESVNQGGEACAACGTPRTAATTLAPPAPEAPAPPQEERETEVPVRELPVRQPARETSYGVDDLDDFFFGVQDETDADDRYVTPEDFELRPRVRVYGCCLPLFLGMLLALIGAATVLADLVIQAR